MTELETPCSQQHSDSLFPVFPGLQTFSCPHANQQQFIIKDLVILSTEFWKFRLCTVGFCLEQVTVELEMI